MENLIASYQEDGGFIVHTCAMLKKLYKALGIDPRSSVESRIFELEGISHFFQSGVLALARKMQIAKHDHVLSLGEGSGAPSRLLAKKFSCRVTGVDISSAQVEKARECALLHGVKNQVSYWQQNVEELALAKNDFTKAFCNETCCHWQHKQKAFARIREHLVPGARIGLNVWLQGDKGSLSQAYDLVPQFRGLYKPGIWFQENLYTYARLLEEEGFRVQEMHDCTDKIDIKIRARVKAGLQWARYEKVMGSQAKESGLRYYKGMLKTHYDFLRYGFIVAEKQ